MIHMPYTVFAALSIVLTITSMIALMVPLEALQSDLDRSRACAAPRDPLAGTLVYVVATGAVALLSFSMLFYAAFCGDTRAVETVDGPYALATPASSARCAILGTPTARTCIWSSRTAPWSACRRTWTTCESSGTPTRRPLSSR